IVMGVLVDAWRVVFPFDFYPLTKHGWASLCELLHTGGRLATEEAWPTIFLWRVGLYVLLIGLGSLAVCVVAILLRRARTRLVVPIHVHGVALRTALVLGLVLDLVSYQAVVYAEAPTLSPSDVAYLDAMTVADWQFQDQRTTKPAGVRQQHAMNLIGRPGAMASYALAYSFAQFDPCATAFRGDWWSAGVVKLLRATSEGEWWEAKGEALARLVGCHSPKLRLVPQAVSTETVEAATALIRTIPDLEHMAVLRGVTLPAQPDHVRDAGTEAAGTVWVTRFTANDLMVEADVPSNAGAWLVYADAFHPGWRATVNGRRAPIAEAYLAFKAVWLNEGHSIVHFTFRHGASEFLSDVIALFGTCAGCVLLAACWWTLWSSKRRVATR
ncbi:MAG: hypothetical protein Q8R78_03475, partial [Candidatus Omnitrophota bacterium]|nr:hypothetical protein [Candidatus Omnitrophota bacterium]